MDGCKLLYRKKVLKPLFKEVKSRTRATNKTTTTKMFTRKNWRFQQDNAPAHRAHDSIHLIKKFNPSYRNP